MVQSAVTPREYVLLVTLGDNSRNLMPLQNMRPDDTKGRFNFLKHVRYVWLAFFRNFLFGLVCKGRQEEQIKLSQIISQT